MPARFTIVGLGEAHFDVFADRQILGGAPVNMAFHAHQLASVVGGRGVLITRIGSDDLGRRLLEELGKRGMTAGYVQIDRQRETGKVYAKIDAGEPTEDVARDAAWDALRHSPDMEDLAPRCSAVCFGTLAQREKQSRDAIRHFLEATGEAFKLYDVNLREGCYDERIIRASCELATAVKVNEEELPEVTGLLGLSSILGATRPGDYDHMATALFTRFRLTMVVLTRAERGAVIFTRRRRIELSPVGYRPDPGADSMGAGDAFSGALLVGMVLDWPKEKTLMLANHVGAYVAARPGATPTLPKSILKAVMENSGRPPVR